MSCWLIPPPRASLAITRGIRHRRALFLMPVFDDVVCSLIRLRQVLAALRCNAAADPTTTQPLDAAAPAVTVALGALQKVFQSDVGYVCH